MKKILCLAASLLALNLMPVFGQLAGTLVINNGTSQNQPPALTKFNLDFPGGTPKELVAAIEKATGKPLNVIVPEEYAQTGIPALKMSNVDVPQLFNAVLNVSYRYGPDRPGYSRQVISSYGFETKDQPVSDNSIWYFFVYQAAAAELPKKIVQFYNLDPFLNRGFTVNDITTAIQTGWEMAGVKPTPELNYHKETKLLIVYGEPGQLGTVDSVFHSLPASNAAQNQLMTIESQIRQLSGQVEQLKKQASAAAPLPAVSPAEKSGK